MGGESPRIGGSRKVADASSVEAPSVPQTKTPDALEPGAPPANVAVPRMRPGSAGAQIAALLANLGEKERALIDVNRDGTVDESEATAAVNVADLDGDRKLEEKEIAALRDILGEAPATLDGAVALLAGKSGERAGKLLKSLEAEGAAAAKDLEAERAALGSTPPPNASAAELEAEQARLERRIAKLEATVNFGAALLEDEQRLLEDAAAKAKLDTRLFALEGKIKSAEQDLAGLEKDVRKGLRPPKDAEARRAEIASLKAQVARMQTEVTGELAAKRRSETEAAVRDARKELETLEPARARVDAQLPYARAKERLESINAQMDAVNAIRFRTDVRTDEALERLMSGAAGAPEAVAKAFTALPPRTVDRFARGQLENADPGSDRAAVAAAVLREAGSPAGRAFAEAAHYGPLALAKRKEEVEKVIEQAESFRDSTYLRTSFFLIDKPDPAATKEFGRIFDQGIADARKLLEKGDPEGALLVLRGPGGAYEKAGALIRKESESLSSLGDRIDVAIWATMVVQDLTVKGMAVAARAAGGPLAGAIAGGVMQALASVSRGEEPAVAFASSIKAAIEESGLLPPGGQAFVDGLVKGFTTLWEEIGKKRAAGEEVKIDWVNVIVAATAEGVISYTTSKAGKLLEAPGQNEAKESLQDLFADLRQLAPNLKMPVGEAAKKGLALELAQAFTEIEGTEKLAFIFRLVRDKLGMDRGPELYELSDPPPSRP